MVASRIEQWGTAGGIVFPKVLIYGASGVGKTVFGSTAPNVLFADCERGMLSVKTDVHRIPISSWSDLRNMYVFLKDEHHEFTTVVIDSLNEVQRLLLDYTLSTFPAGTSGVPRRSYDSLPNINDWGKVLADFEQFVRRMRELDLTVIFLATTAGVPSVEMKVEPAFYGKNTVQTVARYMDVIGYLSIANIDEKATRVLHFDSPKALTKDRTGRLPDSIINATWDDLVAYWNGTKNASHQHTSNREQADRRRTSARSDRESRSEDESE